MQGYKLRFLNEPRQTFTPCQLRFSETENLVIQTEINRLLHIGAIQPSSPERGEFVSHIFTRLKPNGKIRIILNLKPLNQFLHYSHFKMEHLEFALELVKKDSWMGSIDLADAYFSVPIHPDHWKYLKFKWNGILYEYKVMVFGLAQAPYVFTKLCKPVLAVMRAQYGINCSMYLDDILLVGENQDELSTNMRKTLDLLKSLGFHINSAKSVTKPTKTITHLGFIIDSNSLNIAVPELKMQELISKCQLLLNNTHQVKIRQVASVVGSLIAYSKGVKFGKLNFRTLEREKTQALKLCKGNYEAFMKITDFAKQELMFWIRKENFTPKSFEHTTAVVTIFSDASTKGWGGHCGHLKAGGRWQQQEITAHINWLELKASWLCLQSFASQKSSIYIALKLDNTCAIHYINNQGGVNEALDVLTKKIWEWCIAREIHIHASHIPGRKNTIADFNSRNFKDTTEWCLKQDIFRNHIVNTFGIPDVDLFASRNNFKVAQYISWKPEPGSIAVDAFSQNWGKFRLCYAFPPFALVGKVINKAIRDQADLLLVAPSWRTQYWFPMLMKHANQNILKLPRKADSIFLPHKVQATHPIWSKLQLHCFRITGKR